MREKLKGNRTNTEAREQQAETGQQAAAATTGQRQQKGKGNKGEEGTGALPQEKSRNGGAATPTGRVWLPADLWNAIGPSWQSAGKRGRKRKHRPASCERTRGRASKTSRMRPTEEWRKLLRSLRTLRGGSEDVGEA